MSLGDIERIHKRRKHDKESRLATVMVGISHFYLSIKFISYGAKPSTCTVFL